MEYLKSAEGLKKSIQGLKDALKISNKIPTLIKKFNLEDVVKPIRTGRDIGSTVGVIAGAVKGPVVLGNYFGSNVLGIPYASIVGGAVGAIPGAILGYITANTAYKLTKDVVKTSYNFVKHPVQSVKELGSGLKNLVKRPYRLITKPLAYMLVPVLKKKVKEMK